MTLLKTLHLWFDIFFSGMASLERKNKRKYTSSDPPRFGVSGNRSKRHKTDHSHNLIARVAYFDRKASEAGGPNDPANNASLGPISSSKGKHGSSNAKLRDSSDSLDFM